MDGSTEERWPSEVEGGAGSPSRAVLEELLVIRVQEGSRDAFQKLVEVWQERLWRHAYRLTGSEDSAWDVVQESWIAVSKGLGRLREPSAFRTWAYTIVTRAATNRLRRGPQEISTPSETLDQKAEKDTGDERTEAVRSLRAAIQELPGEQRALLSLRYFEELELWEIARILDVPEGTVKSRLHHARNKLKDVFERMNR